MCIITLNLLISLRTMLHILYMRFIKLIEQGVEGHYPSANTQQYFRSPWKSTKMTVTILVLKCKLNYCRTCTRCWRHWCKDCRERVQYMGL